MWQWDRAKQHQQLEAELERISSLEPVPLNSILQPVRALDGEVVNRLVLAQGRYLESFIAANQVGGNYQVALLEVEGSSPRAAILVAREIETGTSAPLATSVEILARILPAQREDLDPSLRTDPTSLSRIDSALLVERLDDPSLALYDGFLLLREERVDGVASQLTPIEDQIAEPTIPGYYWQHIAYVIIWFMMALLVLFLPFYQARRNRLLEREGPESVSQKE